jgi:putative CocE/NonD family hydrolase
VPTLGGALDWQLAIPGMIAGPVEQRPVERRPDVLTYTTGPLASPVEISGPIVANLFASTSAADTDFTAKLCQVLPDGRSYNIQEGILRLSGRDLLGRRQAVTPGEVYELRIGVGQTSIVIPAGSSLRLQVASSNFPHWDRNMNTGHPVGTDAAGVTARQSVYHAGTLASYLELPMGGFRE